MSDYRAIAATTATLQNLLSEAIREPVPGAAVSTGPPKELQAHESSEGVVNVFLYKVIPNTTWRNEELAWRRADGSLIRKPQLAIDLHYLLTFYGDDSKNIPNLLLGVAMAALHAEPYPSERHVPQPRDDSVMDEIHEADHTAGPDLGNSGLLNQHHSLSFSLIPSDLEDVTQTWSTLFTIPYNLSVAYLARVILIEPMMVPELALPVRQPAVYLSSRQQPRLDEVRPQWQAWAPGAEIELRGQNLNAEHILVIVGQYEVEPFERSSDSLRAFLPEGLQAGPHLVQVAHGAPLGTTGELYWDLRSNAVAFVVQPIVLEVEAGPLLEEEQPQGPPAIPVPQERGRQRFLRTHFAPAVLARTDILLLLNESPPPDGERGRRYAIQGTADPSAPNYLEVAEMVAPGRYLVRIQIRGVSSPLGVDMDPDSPTSGHFNAPVVIVPEE